MTSPEMGLQTSSVQGLASSTLTGVPGVHVPVWQVSAPLHWSPSEQEAPLGLAGFEHWPLDGSQEPASWHESLAAQVTGVPDVQVPAWQVSAPLHWSLSAQEVPFGLLGFEQVPVAGSHVPAPWQVSLATQVTDVPGVQVPAWHVSAPLHWSLSAQEVPFGLLGFEHWPFDGLHVPASWHESLARHVTGVPGVQVPAALQVSPPLQRFASAQLVPAATGV